MSSVTSISFVVRVNFKSFVKEVLPPEVWKVTLHVYSWVSPGME